MSKLFSTLFLITFLLFQTASLAEDNVTETSSEEVMSETTDEPQVQEEISEAQKEADEAEAAELRESGVGEEPVVE
jgi:hypothetical protein